MKQERFLLTNFKISSYFKINNKKEGKMTKKIINKVNNLILVTLVACFVMSILTTGKVLASSKHGGALIIGVPGSQKNLNSAIYPKTFSGQLISINLFDGLLRVSKMGDGKLTPMLAKSWDVSSDGKTITLNLRDDVNWHDGKKFTSEDVKYGILNICRPHHPQGKNNYSIVDSIETPGPYKAIIKLSKSDATFLTKLDSKWCSMAPKHILEGQDIPNSNYNNAPIGTGPFKFVEWKKGNYILFERNKDYWAKASNGDQLPYLDKLYFKILPNKTSLISSLEAGEIDFIHSYPGYLAGKEISRVNDADNGIKVHSFAYANMAFDFIYMNTKGKITGNKKVRQALAHLINTDEIIDKVFAGVADNVRNKDQGFISWYTGEAPSKYFPYDVSKAEALLDSAGFKKDANGNRFKISIIHEQKNSNHPKVLDIMRSNLKAAGIELDVMKMDASAITEKVHKKMDYDMYITTIATGPDPDLLTKSWHSKNIGKGWNANSSGYNNKKIDDLLDKGRGELDPVKRKQMYVEAHQILAEDLPMLALYGTKWLWTYNEKLDGFPIGYTFRDGLETVNWNGDIPNNRK